MCNSYNDRVVAKRRCLQNLPAEKGDHWLDFGGFGHSINRVVSRFLTRRFHPKSRRLFPFYFSNITLRTDLLTFGVTSAVFKIAGEMRRLPAYFDNPE